MLSTCPLITASTIGDSKSLKGLLLSGIWPHVSLADSLIAAASYGHEACVFLLLRDGRADTLAFDGRALNNATLQNKLPIVEKLLATGLPVDTLRPSLPWVAHMDYYEMLALVCKYDKRVVFTDEVLVSAFRSRSWKCVGFLLSHSWDVGPSSLHTALEHQTARKHIKRLLSMNARVDSGLFKASKSYPFVEAQLIRRHRVKQLWRRARCLMYVNILWKNFLYDYYSPGNAQYPCGKGYLRTLENFTLRSQGWQA